MPVAEVLPFRFFWFLFFQDTSNRIELANGKIKTIKDQVDKLKQAAEDLKANATNIRELDVTGMCVVVTMQSD